MYIYIYINIVTPPIGAENRNVGESKQQNKTTCAQIYFSETKFNLSMCTLPQFTGSETLYPGLLSRSSGSFDDCYTPLSQGVG